MRSVASIGSSGQASGLGNLQAADIASANSGAVGSPPPTHLFYPVAGPASSAIPNPAACVTPHLRFDDGGNMRERAMKTTINGIGIHYEMSGRPNGPVVVLHHPLASNLASWDALTGALEPNYHVVRFDARGHGQTQAPEGAYTFETCGRCRQADGPPHHR